MHTKTMAELEQERPEDFRNPPQTDEQWLVQRARDKAKRDKEMLTCPIDNSVDEDDDEEEY